MHHQRPALHTLVDRLLDSLHTYLYIMAKIVYHAPNETLWNLAIQTLINQMGLPFQRTVPNDQNPATHRFEAEPGVVALTRKRSVSLRTAAALRATTDAYTCLDTYLAAVARELGMDGFSDQPTNPNFAFDGLRVVYEGDDDGRVFVFYDEDDLLEECGVLTPDRARQLATWLQDPQ